MVPTALLGGCWESLAATGPGAQGAGKLSANRLSTGIHACSGLHQQLALHPATTTIKASGHHIAAVEAPACQLLGNDLTGVAITVQQQDLGAPVEALQGSNLRKRNGEQKCIVGMYDRWGDQSLILLQPQLSEPPLELSPRQLLLCSRPNSQTNIATRYPRLTSSSPSRPDTR